jgi:hypothetical protein
MTAFNHSTVMAGLVPAIHVKEHVDARHKAGHDDFCHLPGANWR